MDTLEVHPRFRAIIGGKKPSDRPTVLEPISVSGIEMEMGTVTYRRIDGYPAVARTHLMTPQRLRIEMPFNGFRGQVRDWFYECCDFGIPLK